MKRLAFVALLFIASNSAAAKCPYAWYEVNGRISDRSHKPIFGAIVSISWSDNLGRHKAEARSKANGTYRLNLPFNTMAGRSNMPGTDYCAMKLVSLIVRVSARDFAEESSRVRFKNQAASGDFYLSRIRSKASP
jgi:hypothetical protein